MVTDREGAHALEVVRFDRTVVDGQVTRHAQEDASQVLGLRPGQKYDPDARTVVRALAAACASPKLAARVLFQQLVYSYVVGNNDVHAKNLSVREDPGSGLWAVTPVYDVLHTWPYEQDHRFFPAIREDGPHDTVTLRHWLRFAADIALPERAARTAVNQVLASLPRLLERADGADLPTRIVRDLRRVVTKRARDLESGVAQPGAVTAPGTPPR